MIKFANIMTLTILTTVLISSSIFTFGIISIHNVKIVFAENIANKSTPRTNGTSLTSTTNSTSAITTNIQSDSTTINLSTKEVSDGVYNWINASNSAQNPTIKVFANTNNILNIQNPTDTKHKLIIDTGADNIYHHLEIYCPTIQGHLSFNPNMTWDIHLSLCISPIYHEKGIIEIDKE